jgi:hypothetical protein
VYGREDQCCYDAQLFVRIRQQEKEAVAAAVLAADLGL